MSQADLRRLIKATWKELALADQTDADSLLEIIKLLMEKLEAFETDE